MNAYESLDLYISTGDQLNALWEFYITIHIALIIASYATKEAKIHWIGCLVVFVSYVGFTFINYRAKINSYEFLIVIKETIVKIPHIDKTPHVHNFFSKIGFEDRSDMVMVIHLLSALIVISAIAVAFKKSLKKEIKIND